MPRCAISARRRKHVLLADVEVHVDRIELHDGREHGRRRAAADILADRNLPRRHDTVERRRDMGVVVVELGELGVGVGLVVGGLRGIAVGQRLIVRRPGVRGLCATQLGLPLELGLGLLQRRLAPASAAFACFSLTS